MVLLVASAVDAQQIDTVFPAPTRRVVDLSSSSGTVQIKTWTRPEIRVEARGSAVSRVRVDLTASMVVVRQVVSSERPVGAVLADTIYDAQGRLIGLRYTLGAVPWFVGDSSARVRYGIDTSRVARDTSGDVPSRFRGLIGGRSATVIPPSPPSSVDFVVTVPRYAGVVVRGGAGDIIVDGAIDSLDLSNVSGSIRATNVTGSVSVTSLEGRVLVEGAEGRIVARTLSGTLTLRNVAGRVDAQAVGGSIDLYDVRASVINASTYEGGISLKGAIHPRATILLTTRSGPIALPDGSLCENAPPGTIQVKLNNPSSAGKFFFVITKKDSTSSTTMVGVLNCNQRRD